MLIMVNYEDLLQNQYNIPKTDFHLYEMCFIKGLTYSSGEESQMGSGTLYATPKYNNTSKYVTFKDIPRYDYIFINNGTDQPTLARILIIFDIELINKKALNDDTYICLLVQQLMKCTPIRSDSETNLPIGDSYQWASTDPQRKPFSYDIITVQSILRPAFVIPDVRNVKLTEAAYNDLFYVLDRKFFDRSGWEIRSHTLNENDYVHNMEQQNDYILAKQTVGHNHNLNAILKK